MKSFFFFLTFIHFLIERDRAWVGEGQRERETHNPKQAPGSELAAQSPTRVSDPWTVRSWPELKSDTRPTEPPRCPDPLWSLELKNESSWNTGEQYELPWLVHILFLVSNGCIYYFRIKYLKQRTPGWLSQLCLRLLILAQVMISQLVNSSSASDSAMSARSLLGILSLPLSASSLLTLSQNKET